MVREAEVVGRLFYEECLLDDIETIREYSGELGVYAMIRDSHPDDSVIGELTRSIQSAITSRMRALKERIDETRRYLKVKTFE
jgi:hypothetical protein